MSGRTQGFVLLLFGVALLRLATTDLLLRFVRASARPWVLVAGGVFVVLAIWTLVVDARGGDDEHVDEHGHRGATRLAWLVVAPVVAVLVIAPQALGAFSADRGRSVVSAGTGTQRFDPLPKGDPVTVSPYDLATRAVLGGGTTLRDRTLRVTGFVARGAPADFTLARLVITCCAADAAPVFVRVQAPENTVGVPRNSWVEVVATYAGVAADARDVPVVRASSVRPVAAPRDPYD